MRKRITAHLSQPTKANLAHLRAPVTVTASTDGDGKQQATFAASPAYSGGKVPRYTTNPPLAHDFVIDLKGMKAAKNVKANLDHKREKRVGHATEVVIGDTIEIAGLLSAATEHSEIVAKSSGNGYGWEVSIEAAMSNLQKLDAGKKAIVNGQEFTGPLLIARKSVLDQVAFVSQGADEGNHVTIAASAAEGANMLTEFEKFIVECGADPETITEPAKAKLQAAFDIQSGVTVRATGEGRNKNFREIAEEERQERDRQDKIAKLGRDAMRDCPLYIDQIERCVEDAIESKCSARDFELDLLRALRTKSGAFSVRAQAGTSSDPRVIEAAICMASGLPNLEKHYSEQTLDAVDRSGMRGFSVQQFLMQAAHQNGYTCRAGERINVGNLRAVLEYAFPPVQARLAGQFSTASLPNILGAVANKQILAGYVEGDMTWKEIAEIKPVSNFYTQNHYRMLDSLEYEEVGSGGEIPHGTLGEETYTSAAKTYGKMLGLTRTQIINDDLGAFNDIRTRLGRGASKKFSNVFWTAFMNNSSFFTAGNTNYITGATTNLGTDGVGLGLMVKAFRNMTSPTADGLKRVGQDINPTIVLVPTELEANALIAYRNTNLGQTANSTANIYQNRFRPVVQWRLSNSSYTGYGDKIWYMFGDEVKPMLVTFLNGNQTPVVESTDADFNTLGIQFRGYHDFGCDKSEYLAGVKSKGEG